RTSDPNRSAVRHEGSCGRRDPEWPAMPERHRPESDHRREYAATLPGWPGRSSATACLLGDLSALELFEKARKVGISTRGWAPAHMRNLGALAGQVHG